MKIYFDTEFTGLHKDTTLISIGLIDENKRTFYAETNDFDKEQIDEWLSENVISNLELQETLPGITRYFKDEKETIYFGDSIGLKKALSEWLSKYDQVKIWSDCLSYDFVLFNHIWGHAFSIPENVYYIPFDICTAFEIKGIDPDISREEFAEMTENTQKHNALWDAKVIKACADKLGV